MSTVIHWPLEKPAIIEAEEERDRRECIALNNRVDGANRELAQWLKDHPNYSVSEVARWLDCAHSKIARLRLWAKNGFVGSYSAQSGGGKRNDRAVRHDDEQKTNEDFEDDDLEQSNDVEDPKQILWHLLDTVKGQKATAEAYRKIFKKSSFDSDTKAQIFNEINQLIVKWRIVQSTLDTKGQGSGS
jgi:hypothetical protein